MASSNCLTMDGEQVQTELELSPPDNSSAHLFELQPGESESGLMKRTGDTCSYHLTSLKQKFNYLQSRLGDEQQKMSQKELILQAHLDEALERIKSQDLALSQKTEEIEELKQDLQRTREEKQENEWHLDPENMILQAQLNFATEHIKSQDLLLNQRAEEAKQIKQDLQRSQSLFISAERELHCERETMELIGYNKLLFEENVKLCAELKQFQTNVVQVKESPQQEIRELELELACNSTSHSFTTSLQKDLQEERVADKKVLELQHQLHVQEALPLSGKSSHLESDIRDPPDTLSALTSLKQIENHMRLLVQRKEELQKQVHSLRLNEVSLSKKNVELSHHIHQLGIRLDIVEAEHSKAKENARHSQNTSHRLQEELAESQLECGRLQEELQEVRWQLSTQVRESNKKQIQHQAALRMAKQTLVKVTEERDQTNQKHINDLMLASVLSEKEQHRIRTVMELNERLLEEKRELLCKVSEAEKMGNKSTMSAVTAQNKVDLLDLEKEQLQDRIQVLSNQVSSLEHALKSNQSFYNLENIEDMTFNSSL